MKKALAAAKQRGFTLIELIVTIVIVGILAGIAIVGYTGVTSDAQKKADEASAEINARRVAMHMAINDTAMTEAAFMDAVNPDAANNVVADLEGSFAMDDGKVIYTPSDATAGGDRDVEVTIADFGIGGGVGSPTVVTTTSTTTLPPVPFGISYDQQEFSTSESSEVLTPTVLGAVGTVTYESDGDLPTGVSFDTATGVFTGASSWGPEIVELDVGAHHACVRLAGNEVDCWSTILDPGTATVLGLDDGTVDNAVDITSGRGHTCAELTTGAVQCWGWGPHSQLGNGSTANSTSPVTVTGLSNPVSIAAGDHHNCAALADGSVQCWGWNGNGQANSGSVSNAKEVAAGRAHSCAIKNDDTVECWGWDLNEQSSVPAGLANVQSVGLGHDHTCALITDGTVECWGAEADGADHGQTSSGSVSGATQIGIGHYHSCALIADGTVECWGRNDYGQLGNGSSDYSSSTPVKVSGISNAIAISAYYFTTCAVLEDGTLTCWGNDGVTTAFSNVPAPVGSYGNPGFPASIEVTATDGTNTAVAAVELTAS